MTNESEHRNQHLEPRVAKLEGQLDRLTEDVRSLASIVRDQGSTVEKQLSELTVAVTQAAGPRKTDWSVIISGILLIMAIGSAAFWPLNQTVQENKIALETLSQNFQNHSQLTLHPFGQALVHRLELQLKDHIESQRRDVEIQNDNVKEMYNSLENQINKQTEYIQKIHELELAALKDRVALHDDRLYGRVVELEDEGRIEVERLKDELQLWRLKALGVTINPSVEIHSQLELKQDASKK